MPKNELDTYIHHDKIVREWRELKEMRKIKFMEYELKTGHRLTKKEKWENNKSTYYLFLRKYPEIKKSFSLFWNITY